MVCIQRLMLHLLTPVALTLVVASGCGKSEAPGSGAATEIRIGYFANVTHAQAVLGVSSGEFAKAAAPAMVSTTVFNAGPSLIEALFAGQIDIGYVGPGPVLNAFTRSKGEGLRVIAGGAANGVLIVARKDSGIKSLADLKGRKIATPQHGNTQDIAARHYLTDGFKQTNTDNVLPIANSEQAAMMARGEIDAAWTPEPWGSRLIAEQGATLVAEEKDLWPAKEFVLTVVVTTPEFLAKHPDAVAKILSVHRSWTKRLNEAPDQHLSELDAALFALTQKKLPAGVLPAAVKHVKFTDEPSEETFKTLAQWSYDLGFTKELAKLNGLIDVSPARGTK
jgi:NitT/TauT family transport system substrate-binding protein